MILRKLTTILALIGISMSTLTGQTTDSTYQTQLNDWYQQAQRQIEQFRFDEALSWLIKCYNKDDDRIDYLAKIAYCHQQMGRYQDARMYYGEVLKRDSININAINSLASIATRVRNYQQAETYYDQLLALDTTNAYYYKQGAFTALRVNKTLKGIGLFLRAHDLNPADMEVLDQLTSIYLSLDQLDFAEQLLRKGLSRAPNNIALLQNQARLHQKRNEHTGIVESIEKTMALGDTNDYYQMMLGVAYLKIDSLDQGIWHLDKIVERNEATDKTHHYLGLAHFYKKNYEKADEHFSLAIELGVSPKMGDYYEDLAQVKLKTRNRPQAIALYKKALEFKQDPETLYLLANQSDIYYRDKSIALRLYREYVASGDSTYMTDAEARIKHLREVVHQQAGGE
jgi:tetratricopeptide (TPR) repeat protein